MPDPAAAAQRQAAEHRLAVRRGAPPSPQRTPLVWVAIACGVGLIAAWLGEPGFESAGMLATVFLLAWLGAWRGGRNALACGLLLAAAASLAAAWSDAGWRLFASDDVGRLASIDATPVCLEGVVCSPPRRFAAQPASPYRAIPPSDRTTLRLQVDRLRDGREWREVSGECELTVLGTATEIAAADRVRVFGQLRAPRPAGSPGERDEAKHERAERRLALVWTESPDCVSLVARPPASSRANPVAAAQRWAKGRIDARAPGDSGPLLNAMILGDTSGLDRQTIEAFRKTGAMHLLVVSGLHLGLAAGVLPGLAALGLLPRRAAWVAALLLAVVYAALAGGRPPAVRAGVVVAAACLAALWGRRSLSANSLAGAAIVVLAVAPTAWFRVGTQLSFMAASALLGVSLAAERRRSRVTPPLDRLIAFARPAPWRFVRRGGDWSAWAVTATAAVQLVTAPLVASTFHLLSPAAAPLTLIASPLIGVTVASGLTALALEAFGLPQLAQLAAGLAGWAAEVLAGLIGRAADSSLSAFWVTGPAPWWTAAWTLSAAGVALAWVYRGTAWGVTLRAGLALAAAWFAPSLWAAVAPAEGLRVSFLAVGHGNATLLEPPSGGAVLVDAGALGSPERVTDVIARSLWSRGIERLDAVVLTHADLDHYNALPGLLDRFEINAVWTTSRMLPRWADPLDRSGPASLARLLRERGVPVRVVATGDRLRIGASSATVFHPDAIGLVGSDNANSLVLGVEYAGHRVLLPGDLESPGLEVVLAQEPYDCDLLLAPHHGSRLSNPPGFAAWCRPEAVVISSAKPAGEASAAYRAAGATIWATRYHGTITAQVTPTGVRLSGFRNAGSR